MAGVGPELLKLQAVMAMVSLKSLSIYQRVNDGNFPQQVKIGGAPCSILVITFSAWTGLPPAKLHRVPAPGNRFERVLFIDNSSKPDPLGGVTRVASSAQDLPGIVSHFTRIGQGKIRISA